MSGLWLCRSTAVPSAPGIQQHGEAVAFDRSGRWLAAGGGLLGQLAAPGENVVRVWDLETREVRVLAAADGAPIATLAFLPDGRLLAAGPGGVRLWDLQGHLDLRCPDVVAKVLPSPDGRRLLLLRAPLRPGGAVGGSVYDFDGQRSSPLVRTATE